MVDHLTVTEAFQRLAAAAHNGNRARRRLARKLASLPPDQLRRVNPEVFVRLGPQGLLLFALLSKSIRNVVPPPAAATTPKTVSIFEKFTRTWHFAHPLLKCLAVAVLCGGGGLAASRLSHPLHDLIGGHRAEVIAGWPVCERLDLDERGCIYRASSDQLTLGRVATLSGLSPDVVTAANPHLDFRSALPRGALLLIPNPLP
jgi:hypothetical protein